MAMRPQQDNNYGFSLMFRVSAVVLLALCSLLTGCLVDGVKGREQVSQHKPDERFFYISGRIAAGVMDGAIVRVHPYKNGILSTDSVAEGVTDVKGFYQMQVPREYLGKSVLISASSLDRIKCDLVSGCSDVAFGEWLVLDDNEWVLNAAIPDLNENGIYNGTALTHLGYALMQSDLSGGIAENNTTDMAVKARMMKSNSKVVSAFGLVGDLPRLNVFDITNSSDYESATALEVRYSIMNSAVVASATDIFDDSNQFSALSKFSVQFVEDGIPGYSPHNLEVTQIQLLERFVEVLSYLQESTGADFTVDISEALTLRNLYMNEAAQEYGRGTSTESAGLNAVAQAKKMLSSVREVAFSMDLRKLAQFSNLATFTSGDAADALEGFGIVIDTAELIGSQKTDRLVTSLMSVTQGILEILTLYYERKPIPPEVQGIKIVHTGSAQRHAFEIRDLVNACEPDRDEPACEVPVDLMVTMDMSYFGGNLGASLIVIDDLKLSVAGVVGDGQHRLIFPGTASAFTARQLFFEERVDMVEGKFLFEVNQWSLDVPFSITSSNEGIDASMPIMAQASGDRLGITWEDQENVIGETDGGVESSVTRMLGLYDLKGFSANAAVSVNVNPADQFFAAFNIKQAARAFEGAAVYKTSYRKVCDRSSMECSKHDEKTEIEGETNENFVQLSASAAYKATLKGIQSPVLIQITGSRESPQTNNVSNLKVSYPGHALALNGKFSNNGNITALDAINLDGMHLYFNTINGKRTGAVETPSKERVADVIDMGQWVKVRYANGDFESF